MKGVGKVETVWALKKLRQHPLFGLQSLVDALESALRPSYGKCYRLCNENRLLTRKKRQHSLTTCGQRAPQSDDLAQRDFTTPALCMKFSVASRRSNMPMASAYLDALMDLF